MTNKSAKYRLKILCLTIVPNNVLNNYYTFTGKDSNGKTLNDEEKTLMNPT